jgi:putative CocE/NonD family hydrolase
MAVSLPDPHFDVLTERDIRIPMRDGVSLIADVHRPRKNGQAAAGKFPVILVRTCYDKDEKLKFFPGYEYFVTRGYVVIVQDTRGRYKSPGRVYNGI